MQVADHVYSDYRSQFLYPPDSLMVRTGLWLELETGIGFIVGLGLGSLLGQRTVSVILMIVLEIVLTPAIIQFRSRTWRTSNALSSASLPRTSNPTSYRWPSAAADRTSASPNRPPTRSG